MKRHSIYSILETQYGRLEKDEASLRSDLAKLRTAKLASLKPLITTLYHDCTDKSGKLNYNRLFEKIPRQEAVELRHMVEKAQKTANIDALPLTVTSFDQLNRLNAATVKMALNEVELADEIHDIYDIFLFAHIAVTITTVSKTLAISRTPKDKDIEAIINNTEHPIRRSLMEQHVGTARQAADMLRKLMLGGTPVDDTVRMVTDYSERHDKNTDDRLVYTNNTRVTGQAVAEVIEEYAKTFHTVCVHDGKACGDCTRIEEEQGRNPVPFEDFLPGVTAPPFHPWCRCSYEVEWR